MILNPGQLVTVGGQQIICLPIMHILDERVCWRDGYGQTLEHGSPLAYFYEVQDLSARYASSGWEGRPDDDDFSACDPSVAETEIPIGVIQWIDGTGWMPLVIYYDFYGNTIDLYGDQNSPGGVPHTTNCFVRSGSATHYGLFARPLPVDEESEAVVIVPILAGLLLFALLLSGYAGGRRFERWEKKRTKKN